MAQTPAHPLFDPNLLPSRVEVCCFESPLETLAEAAFTSLVSLRLSVAAAPADVVVCAPSGERWKVADLEPVLHALSLTPLERKMMLLLAADTMDSSAYDRLLKLVEEPPSPCTIVFAAPIAAELPATLRGRFTATCQVPVPLPEGMGDLLRELALPASLLGRIEHTDVLSMLPRYPRAAELAALLPPNEKPASSVQALLSWADDLAVANGFAAAAAKRFRPRVFRFVLAVLECRIVETVSCQDRVRSLLEPLATARAALVHNMAPAPHLTVAFAACCPN
jgi:hypothetical protein